MSARLFLLGAASMLVPCFALRAQRPAPADSVARDLARLETAEGVTGLPAASAVPAGPLRVAAGTQVRGPVVARGPVEISGTVNGSVVSLGGDVTVHRGGHVTGDALAVGGHVFADSGRVDGELRAMSGLPALLAATPVTSAGQPGARQVASDVRGVLAFFATLLVVALGVLLFAPRNLDEVVGALERQFARVFWTGVLGQVLILPALLVLIVALAVSIIGILLIPFAIVAFGVAVVGLLTLGFLAVARLLGAGLWRGGSRSPRLDLLITTAVGIGLFFSLWMIAALAGWAPLAASVVRAAALAATWAAVTLGLGAAILTRAGTHRRVPSGQRPVPLAAWQTPTPISGVIAARRPVVSAGDQT